MFDVKEILTAGMVLFAVIDIIGSTPHYYRAAPKGWPYTIGKGILGCHDYYDWVFVFGGRNSQPHRD